MRLAAVALRPALALALAGGTAAAQQQSLRDQLVGTWQFVVAEVTAPDGKKWFPFGETPKGILVFTPDGHFTQIPRGERRAEDRLQQPPDRHARGIGAIMRRSLSVFGTYTVDEAKKTVTYQDLSRRSPTGKASAQTRTIDKLTAEEFVNTTRTSPAGAARRRTCIRRVK